MMPRQTCVSLLVWRPADPDRPTDVSQSWPSVLEVTQPDGSTTPPGVLLRPGEPLLGAARRAATAVGLRLPDLPRLLAVDQRPADGQSPEQLCLVVDGGWSSRGVGECTCGEHTTRWTAAHDLQRASLVYALRVAVTGHPLTPLWNGAAGEAGAGG